jgi:hypothetical protein
VEVGRRSADGKDIFVFVNFAQENRNIALPHKMKLLLSGNEANSVQLAPYGVEVAQDSR